MHFLFGLSLPFVPAKMTTQGGTDVPGQFFSDAPKMGTTLPWLDFQVFQQAKSKCGWITSFKI